MSDLIRVKRGLKADLPELMQGEFGYCTDTEELFVGGVNGNVYVLQEIANQKTINLYVATTGSDLNSGLDALNPFATVQKAFDFIDAFAYRGAMTTFIVNIAAGLYTEFNATLTTPTNNRVVIQGVNVGASPAVPTTVFDGAGGGDYDHGIRISGVGVRAEVKNIKFQNFTSNDTRIGLSCESESDVYAVNIHATNCDWAGLQAFNTLRVRFSGGIFDGCRSGVILNSTQATLGYNNDEMLFKNCTENGVYFSRGSQGHIDYCRFEDNAIGILIAENSRVHTVQNEFLRNSYAIRTQTGGVYADNANVFFASPNENTRHYDYKALSGETDELSSATSWIRIASDRTTHSVSGTTPTTISTPYTIPAYRLLGPDKQCRVNVFGVLTQATNGSNFTINFGGMVLTLAVVGTATGVVFQIEATLCELQGGYRAFGKISHGLSNFRLGNVSSGFDNAADQDISVATTLANAGDSIIVYRVDVEIIG